MFENLDKNISNFIDGLSEIEKDRNERIAAIKRIDDLLKNSYSNDEKSDYQIMGNVAKVDDVNDEI